MAVRFLYKDKKHVAAKDAEKSVFVTGGIGDVIALSCFLEVPKDIKTIFYATRKQEDVESYLSPLCPPDTQHISVWTDWSTRWGWYSLNEFWRAVPKHREQLAASIDWSIATIFPQDIPFRGFPWRLGDSAKLARKFSLPKRYIAFQPFSSDKRDSRRDFTAKEIADSLAWSRKNNIPLVHINHGDDPPIAGVIDLQNQTNLRESIDITLGAAAYIGIDSSMSQVATKVLPSERLLVKSTNYRHYYPNLHWYVAPHHTYEFVGPDASLLLNRLSIR